MRNWIAIGLLVVTGILVNIFPSIGLDLAFVTAFIWNLYLLIKYLMEVISWKKKSKRA